MARIFISYSRVDEAFARQLAASLSGLGADIWLDVEDIPAGMNWSRAIQQGLDDAQAMILILSPDSMASTNVENEWQYFLDHKKPVIPVLLRQTRIHFQLNRIQYIDFTSQPYDNGLRQLVAELARKGYQVAEPHRAASAPPPSTPVYTAPPPPLPTYAPQSQPTPGQQMQSTPAGIPRGLLVGGGGLAALLVIVILAAVLTQQQNAPGVFDADGTAAALRTLTATHAALVNAATSDVPTANIPTTAPTAAPTDVPPSPTATTRSVFLGPVTRNADWQWVERTFDGVPMVLVPRGAFMPGATDEQLAYGMALCRQRLSENNCNTNLADERGDGRVMNMDTPFWIDQYEVSESGVGSLPINNVTWQEAEAICQQRGARLPTEWEWEYAARGPDGLIFPWGNTLNEPARRLNVCDGDCARVHNFGWADQSYRDGYAARAPVGSFPAGASWVGAHDMAGNLWEWTSTPYDAQGNRTLRGSSWNWVASEARTTSRDKSVVATGKSDWCGFRCVRAYREGDVQ